MARPRAQKPPTPEAPKPHFPAVGSKEHEKAPPPERQAPERKEQERPPVKAPEAEIERLPLAGDVDPEDAPQGRPSKAGAVRPATTPARTAAGRRTASAVVQGRAVSQDTQVDRRVRIRASENPNFVLTFDPLHWNYIPAVGKILPEFGRLRLVPGIGRVDSKGNPAAAFVEAQKAGRILIFDRDIPGGYLREYDMLGGVGFLPKWERVNVTGKVAILSVDWEDYEDFVEGLLADGKIEPIDEATIAHLRARSVNMRRLLEPRKSQESVAKQIELLEKEIACCDALMRESASHE